MSRYLLSISLINVAEGIAVGAGLLLVGVPSAALWGALAGVTNFIVFLGPLLMTIVLFARRPDRIRHARRRARPAA